MNSKKTVLLVSFALFSLFFGAGNLILPPQLGFKAGDAWFWVTFGFCLSAVIIPILGILAHAKLQGTIFDFAKKVSPKFSLVYCFLVYAISISLPSPRTASVTHEMGIAPLFDSSALTTSIVYFILVFLFVMNRSKILDIIGKLLTPAIILILLGIIGVAFFDFDFNFGTTTFESPFTHGILEGYQTFDAIGAIVVGGVIIISINLKEKEATYTLKKQLIAKAGWFAGLGLFLIYAGLIITGALVHNEFDADSSRTALLSGISLVTLGSTANLLLAILVSLACFTTAVGIVTGTADFVKSQFKNSQTAYLVTAILGCLLGIVMGQFNVGYIIAVALPALMFIYPITIVLILLNVLPDKFATPRVFRWVVLTTILFSIPDFMGSAGWGDALGDMSTWIPLSQFQLGWVLPSLVVFVISNTVNNPTK
ncbi:MAG: branched-chain amino acid transport system II carrier protein [Croceitalea sp.]|nr:branched-chain amino acid transport system II carrier protein [Croceitalea sp.]MBT8238201.1 branched-chain amino acid transport system II carrier protein [Croceitalea sp.]NNC33976.1 branched-chain amino acid transport system II carrier protein [Croceitalea sp.]NNL09600.1 branched-chain amino acid transport system II carrier protein [Croceitalea sp.]NNM18419.1 branched-chain amino acid transport system II carrier protein [Croceitalea sp.]